MKLKRYKFMKRLFLFLSLAAIFMSLTAQTGNLPYKKVIQAYRGDTLYSLFDGDSVRLVTNKKWAFNPKISGGETLGNPTISGMLLKSTTAGVRSWGYPDRIRNYNLADTGIVIRTVPEGKIGSYTRSVNGYYNKIDTVNAGGYVGRVDVNNGRIGQVNTNNAGGLIGYVSTNNADGYVGRVDANSGIIGRVNTNNAGGYVGLVDVNSGRIGQVNTNNAGGYVGLVDANSGICNSINNKKSTTSGTHEIISGRVSYDSSLKWFRDSIGLSHGEIPSASGFDTTVNLSVTLTDGVWQKVTNSTNNIWSLVSTSAYMTFSADSVINTYAGKYEYTFNLSANGKDGATYEYRVRKKSGTTISTIRKIKITGGGVNVERTISCMPLLSAGDRVWLELRFTGSPTGSPVSIFGSYFSGKAVYLSL